MTLSPSTLVSFNGLDTLEDGLTELLHALFFRRHPNTRHPAIGYLEPEVCDRALSLILKFEDGLRSPVCQVLCYAVIFDIDE